MVRDALLEHRTGPACRGADGAVLLWPDLQAQAARLAGLLTAHKVRRAVVYGPAGPDAMTAIAACLLAGVTYIPLDADTPPARLHRICTASGAKALLAAGAVPAAAPLPVYGPRDWAAAPPLTALPVTAAEDIAYILFTSGSTGAPRGVCVTYGNLESFLRWFFALPAIAAAPPPAIACAARFAFDLSVAALYPVFARGGCLEQGAPVRSGTAALLVCTPSALDAWLLDEGFAPARLPALRTVFCCGEVLRPATVRRLWQRFPGVRVLNAYGPTEAACAVCAAEILPAMLDWPALPVGRAAGEAVGITVTPAGCLQLTGASVAAGYLDDDGGVFGSTAGQRRFLTADRGRIQDGYVWFLGRADDQLKYKGYRIEPAEIEAALCAVPGVHGAAVTARRLPDGRVTALTAHVAADNAMTEEALRRALATVLPDYMLPKEFRFCSALPLTVNGKLDRKRLADADRP